MLKRVTRVFEHVLFVARHRFGIYGYWPDRPVRKSARLIQIKDLTRYAVIGSFQVVRPHVFINQNMVWPDLEVRGGIVWFWGTRSFRGR